MPDYNGFFLNSNSSVIQYELLEFSHSSFSTVYRIVRNASSGVNVRLEDGTSAFFQYYPVALDHGEENDDLDQSLQVTFGDLGETLPPELDRVVAADLVASARTIVGTHRERPIMLYRSYRSDDLTAPMEGPTKYEMRSITPGDESATMVCAAPQLNNNGTGETYTFTRFPMLNGIL